MYVVASKNLRALALTLTWACAAGTYRHVHTLSSVPAVMPRLSLASFLKDILSTLRNRNYIIVLIGYFFYMIASGIYDTLNVFINTYFWELRPEQIRWVGLIGAPAAMLGALSSPILMRFSGRKTKKSFLSSLVNIYALKIFFKTMMNLLTLKHFNQ